MLVPADVLLGSVVKNNFFAAAAVTPKLSNHVRQSTSRSRQGVARARVIEREVTEGGHAVDGRDGDRAPSVPPAGLLPMAKVTLELSPVSTLPLASSTDTCTADNVGPRHGAAGLRGEDQLASHWWIDGADGDGVRTAAGQAGQSRLTVCCLRFRRYRLCR